MNALEYSGVAVDELRQVLSKLSANEASAIVADVLTAKRIFVAGAGRSGLMAKAFAMRLMHLGYQASVIGETVTPSFAKDDLLVLCSGSGETGSLVSIARKARQIGGRLALVTIVRDSTIGQLADNCLVVPAPSPKAKTDGGVQSVQPMGSLFEQALLVVLDAMILELMTRSGTNADLMFTRHANLE